jgi:hypothetical protein
MLRKFTVKWRNHINDILSFWAVYEMKEVVECGGVGVRGTLLQSSI